MKKIKLIMPIFAITAMAGTTTALTSCSKRFRIRFSADSLEGVTVASSKLEINKESTITLKLPTDKFIKPVVVKIDNKLSSAIYKNGVITIPATDMTGYNIEITIALAEEIKADYALDYPEPCAEGYEALTDKIARQLTAEKQITFEVDTSYVEKAIVLGGEDANFRIRNQGSGGEPAQLLDGADNVKVVYVHCGVQQDLTYGTDFSLDADKKLLSLDEKSTKMSDFAKGDIFYITVQLKEDVTQATAYMSFLEKA